MSAESISRTTFSTPVPPTKPSIAPPSLAIGPPTTGAGSGLRRGRWVLLVQMIAPVVAGLLVAVLISANLLLIGLVLLVWLVANFHSGGQAVRPGLPHIIECMRAAIAPFACVGLGVAVGILPPSNLDNSALVLSAATSVLLASTVVLPRVLAPVRLLVVGDRMSIAQAEATWARLRNAEIVGALLIEPEVVGGFESSISMVRPIDDLSEVPEWVTTTRADVVVASSGPGVTSDDVRRLSWLLEGSGAALAVRGVLDSVAPHRIDSTTLGTSTLTQIRSSKPSGLIRFTKAAADRMLAALLLLLFAPLMTVMLIAVRLDSSGKGLFKQTRVGRNGRHFTMYKMRTMCVEAESLKAQLKDEDEGNGVLFKIANDPRVTRVGKVLRKTSLDELPQLINVVKGDMSLIGPRPALPDEVAQYDSVALRRLAVRPGITGLWQVSGRSNLSWDESVRLDVRYTDNWRLVDDAMIMLRTPDAVVRSRGAY